MSLRLRVWLGIATIAVLVVASAFATHRLVERSLIDQVDARLRSVPIDRGFGRIPSQGLPPDAALAVPRFNAFFIAEYSAGTLTPITSAGTDQHVLPVPDLTSRVIDDAAQLARPRIFTASAPAEVRHRESHRKTAGIRRALIRRSGILSTLGAMRPRRSPFAMSATT